MNILSKKIYAQNAFTLIELLAVIATAAMLATLLLPAMAGVKVRTSVAGCFNNQKQLAMAWRMFAEDNNGSIIGMGDNGPSGAPACWIWRPGNINFATWTNDPSLNVSNAAQAVKGSYEWGYRISTLARYAPNVDIIHCPADGRLSKSVAPGYCSYSGANGLGQLANTANIQHPAERFLWIEENDTRGASLTIHGVPYVIGENVGTWSLKVTNPTPPGFNDVTSWFDAPAVYHINSTTFSWADGHVSIHRWLSAYTISFANDPVGGRAGNYDSLKTGGAGGPWFQDLFFTASSYATSDWP